MLEVLIVRHAPAGTRQEFAETGQDDGLRPLTTEGRREMARAAQGLRWLLPEIGTLWTSPLVRAHQTAEIVGEAYGATPKILAALAPDGEREAALAALRNAGDRPPVFVGHEPSLSRLVGWLVAGEPRSLVQLKKGAACLLRFEAAPRAGGASLQWLLQPRALRRLGR